MGATHGDVCLADSATTHTILKNKKYFTCLKEEKTNVCTIAGSTKLIDGSGRANILLPNGTNIEIQEALYSPKSKRNLLSFNDIRRNGFHVETANENGVEYLYITRSNLNKKSVLEKLQALSSGLYYMKICAVESHALVNQKFTDKNKFIVWHDRFGHPGSLMMRKIIENSRGHLLENQKNSSN
ncbi:uncharacterized protein LOC141627346 [Silene latifolia]|uniref:uncharacterized protein LOC141627346 n=1 Tax=Silene latifolia TaxID=37657 RepID=UPI003D77F1DE